MEQHMMCKFIYMNILVVLILVLNTCSCDSIPQVETEYGTFIGNIMKTRDGRDINAYLGIPFAKPPVGNLRYQEPQMIDKNYKVYNATSVSSECVQEKFDFDSSSNSFMKNVYYGGSEDCLYLNVYVPKVEKDVGKLPVLFFIHGGGYAGGSGSPEWNGPALLLDKDIIMVATNYRLSILGFMSYHEELPGNLGLKDQVMALKWVKQNIAAFGGDPDLITIAGISAGGASVSLLMHSPLSKGFFQRAIAQSGIIDCQWALRSRKEANKVASKIIEYLGCSTEPQLLLRCLQKMPVNELFDAVKSLKVAKLGFEMYLGPIIENELSTAFLTQKSIEEGSEVPLLTGVTSEEGINLYNQFLLEDPGYADLTPLKQDYNILLPHMSYYSEYSNADDISNKLVQYYMGDEGFSNATVPQFIKLLSDTMFNHGLHAYAKKHKGKLYQYLNNYYTTQSLFSQNKSPTMEKSLSHGDDMMFLYNMNIFPITLKEDELKFSNFLIDLWTNFIRVGDPTPDSKLWKESVQGSEYIEFNNDVHVMKKDMFKERMEFLDSISFEKLRALQD